MRRRTFVRGASVGAAAWITDRSALGRLLAQTACADEPAAGELVAVLPLTGDRPRQTPFGEPVGGPGLDTRVFTDLSTIQADRLITPAAQVFVRTAAPPGVETGAASWSMSLAGSVTRSRLAIGDLLAAARPMGAHLVECAGNNDPNNFGLLSVAEWSGVPLAELVDRLGPRGTSYGVLVSGLDDETRQARSSVAGASWVLPWDAIAERQPFLAVGMNGAPLTPDHGAPVRLVVPGWYGCSWIKWVQEMRLVDEQVPATTQMLEFAGRTHQDGRPELARNYAPPVIDLAATPIRVEQRRLDGRLEYRVVGIVWGGTRAVSELLIRVDSRDAWRPLRVCPSPTAPATWSLWSYRWTGVEPGTYSISITSADPSIRTRRLDLFFYTRRVRVP